jgi:hypothetical protein
MLTQTANHDRAFGADNLCANIIAIQALGVGLNIPNGTTLEAEIDRAGHHIIELRKFRPDGDCGERMDLGHFIVGEPARRIEIVNRASVKEHSVDS